MNFFDGRLVRVDGTVCCQISGFNLRMDKQKEQALARHLGEEVVFGIRPEHIVDRRLVPDAPPDAVMSTKIDVAEPLGNEVFLYLVPQVKLGEGTFIARMGPETWARPGQDFEVVFDMTKVHVFEKESGLTIV
jgi:multiple sugar transport system ATP-binding protein